MAIRARLPSRRIGGVENLPLNAAESRLKVGGRASQIFELFVASSGRRAENEQYAGCKHVYSHSTLLVDRYGCASRAFTTNVPFICSWPSPQNSVHRIGNSPAASAMKSMLTVSPRGISFDTLNRLMPNPWSPSPDFTTSRTRSPWTTSTEGGTNS